MKPRNRIITFEYNVIKESLNTLCKDTVTVLADKYATTLEYM